MRTHAAALALSKLALLALFSSAAIADHRHAEALFGLGLNTAQPGNSDNHVIIPKLILVKTDGVVDFSVAGFHDIIVFKPGFSLQDLKNAGGGDYPTTPPVYVLPPVPPTAAVPWPPMLAPVFDKIYYLGINPAGGPLNTPPTPIFAPPPPNPVNLVSNALNRPEQVAFLDKGLYLVICNIRPHLVDGMYAYVWAY
jgi:hypothetical protein